MSIRARIEADRFFAEHKDQIGKRVRIVKRGWLQDKEATIEDVVSVSPPSGETAEYHLTCQAASGPIYLYRDHFDFIDDANAEASNTKTSEALDRPKFKFGDRVEVEDLWQNGRVEQVEFSRGLTEILYRIALDSGGNCLVTAEMVRSLDTQAEPATASDEDKSPPNTQAEPSGTPLPRFAIGDRVQMNSDRGWKPAAVVITEVSADPESDDGHCYTVQFDGGVCVKVYSRAIRPLGTPAEAKPPECCNNTGDTPNQPTRPKFIVGQEVRGPLQAPDIRGRIAKIVSHPKRIIGKGYVLEYFLRDAWRCGCAVFDASELTAVNDAPECCRDESNAEIPSLTPNPFRFRPYQRVTVGVGPRSHGAGTVLKRCPGRIERCIWDGEDGVRYLVQLKLDDGYVTGPPLDCKDSDLEPIEDDRPSTDRLGVAPPTLTFEVPWVDRFIHGNRILNSVQPHPTLDGHRVADVAISGIGEPCLDPQGSQVFDWARITARYVDWDRVVAEYTKGSQ